MEVVIQARLQLKLEIQKYIRKEHNNINTEPVTIDVQDLPIQMITVYKVLIDFDANYIKKKMIVDTYLRAQCCSSSDEYASICIFILQEECL